MISLEELLATSSEEDLDRIKNSIKLKKNEQLSLELLQEIIEPEYIGPSWMKDSDGNWLLPEHTLGWEVAGWCTKYLLNPQDSSKPWKFTPEQLRIVLWWYAVDEMGQFKYQTGVIQRRKGWGKDPLLAVFCIVEMVGPCRFSHWDPKTKQPVAKSENAALVLVSAVTKDQTNNTADMFPLLFSKLLISTYKVVPGIELIRAHGGKCKIMLLTGSYRAAEGKRSTFTVLNETHHWVSGNGGPQMYQTIDGNTSKNPTARYLAITNAFLPGEESVAESMRDDYNNFKQLDFDSGFFYDSVEAKARAPIGGPLLPYVLQKMLGDSVWVTEKAHIDSMIKSIMKSSISPARSRRMWLNQVRADEDALYSQEDWDSIRNRDLVFEPGDQIVLGLDGGKTDDSTMLVGIRLSDMAVALIGSWEKPLDHEDKDWQVDKKDVDGVVANTHSIYDVVGFFADVAEWEVWIVEWEELYGGGYGIKASERTMIGFDMRGNLKEITLGNEALYKAIMEGAIQHDGDIRLRRHVLNVRRRLNKWGVSFGKEHRESAKKVDGYAALLLAYLAAVKARLKSNRPPKKKAMRSFFM